MSNPKWPQQPNLPPQPGAPQSPFGAPAQPAAQPFAATQAMDFSPGQFQGLTPGAQPPPQQAPWGAQPSQQGVPFGQPSQQGAPFAQPSQQGAPYGQQPAWGQPPQQQPPWGQQPQQPPWGQQPQQPPWGQQSTAYAAPPARPASANGASTLGMLAAAALVVVGIGAKVALRTGGRSIARNLTSSSSQRPMLPIDARGRTPHAVTPDEQLQDKISPYIEHCLNRFSRDVFRSESRYFDWVDRRKGPTGRERNVYGMPNVLGDPAECQRAVASAAAMAPSAPDLEGAGARFSAALSTLVPIIHQVHTYYVDPTVYRGDQMARGILLHPQYVSALEGFTAAQRALSDAVSQSQDEATEGFLARVRNDPSAVVEYNLKSDQRMARHLARMIRGWQVDRRGVITGIDAAQFAPAVTEYEAGVGSLSNASMQNPSQALAIRGLPLYQARSAAYLRQLQGLSLRLQSGQAFTRPELRLTGLRMGWTVQGSPDAVTRAYDELIQSYNALR